MAPKKKVLEGMSAYHLEVVGRLVDDQRTHFERHADAVMDELLKLDVRDPAIGGTAARGLLEISVEVDAISVEDAVRKGTTAIRSAIDAAGGRTPHWRVLLQDVVGRPAGLVGA